jgi:archaellum component FlaC
MPQVVVQGFASLNDKVDSGLASVNDKVDSGFAAVQARFEHVEDELGRVKDALMEHGRQLKDIRAALDRDELDARH